MNAEKIYNIKYVDAYYVYDKKIGKTKLSLFEAYGYVERKADSIIIFFIKKMGVSNKKIIEGKENIVKGLIIPDTALMSAVDVYKTDLLKNVVVGSDISITWRDVGYVANLPAYDHSVVMYTEGVLYKIEKDYIVLKDPQTVRTYPLPIKNHPGSGRPTFLVVPTSFITNVTIIK